MNAGDEKIETRPHISIVATMYHSRSFLEHFLAECLQALAFVECSQFEIMLVHDGSPDDSFAYAISRRSDIPQLVVVDLSRNFGHHYAMQAGIRHAQGDWIFLIDCDLDISPLNLPELKIKLNASASNIVYGYWAARICNLLEKNGGSISSKNFYLNSGIRIAEYFFTDFTLTNRYDLALLKLGECTCFWVAVKLNCISGKSSVHFRLNAVFRFGIYPNVLRCRSKPHMARRRTSALETKASNKFARSKVNLMQSNEIEEEQQP